MYDYLSVCVRVIYMFYVCSFSFSAPSLQELLAVKMFLLCNSGMLNGKSDFS